MKKPILNLSDVELHPWSHGDKYEARLGPIAVKLGAKKLGYNLTILPPGKCAFPLHNHQVNEEMFFILEGAGVVRIGKEHFTIGKGDVIASPPGGPESAHQIMNTSHTEDLRMLAVSTMLSPEVVEYPDSGKFGVRAELAPNADGSPRLIRYNGREGSTLDYWDGE